MGSGRNSNPIAVKSNCGLFSPKSKLSKPCHHLEIKLDNPLAIYKAGEKVTGNVILTTEHSKDLKNIRIRFYGKARVHWTQCRGSVQRCYTKHFGSEEVYFADEKILFGNDSKLAKLPPGTHTYPFAYTLPAKIPSSFSHSIGSVSYHIEAVMRRSWYKEDTISSLKFDVEGTLDLNLYSLTSPILCSSGGGGNDTNSNDISAPFQLKKRKQICDILLLCSEQQVTFSLKLSQRGFVPGDKIHFQAEIDNSSRHELKPPKLKLIQTQTFCSNGLTKRDSCIAAKVKGQNGVGPVRTEHWIGDGTKNLLIVPQVPPTRLGGCGVIDLQYSLRFEVRMKGSLFWKMCSRDIPLVIGTVPIGDGIRSGIVGFGIITDNPNPTWSRATGRPTAPPQSANSTVSSRGRSYYDNQDELAPPPPYNEAVRMRGRSYTSINTLTLRK